MHPLRLRRIAHLLAAAAVIGLACGKDSPTAPAVTGAAVRLSLFYVGDVEVVGPSISEVYYRCVFGLGATAEPGRDAVWQDAELRVASGANRSVFGDTLRLSPYEVRGLWGIDTVRRSLYRTGIAVTGPSTFTAEVVIRAMEIASGRITADSVRGVCGPTVTGNSPGPAISLFQMAVPKTELQAGDTLQLQWGSAAPLGLTGWSLAVDGACTFRFYGLDSLRLQKRDARIVVLPPSCKVGSNFRFTLTIQDAIGRQAAETLAGPVFVDRRPPVVNIQLTGLTTTTRSTLLIAGDSLQAAITAQDDRQLQRLTWHLRPAGVGDSVFAAPRTATASANVVFRPPATPVDQTVEATGIDSSGNAGLTSLPVRVLPRFPMPALVSGSITQNLRDQVVVFDDTRDVIYHLESCVLRAAPVGTSSALWTLPVPGCTDVTRMSATASGDSLLLTLNDSAAIGVVAVGTGVPVLSILPVPLVRANGGYVYDVAALNNGKAIVHSGPLRAPAWPLQLLDLATRQFTSRPDAPLPAFQLHQTSDFGAVTYAYFNAGRYRVIRYRATTNVFDSTSFALGYADNVFTPTPTADAYESYGIYATEQPLRIFALEISGAALDFMGDGQSIIQAFASSDASRPWSLGFTSVITGRVESIGVLPMGATVSRIVRGIHGNASLLLAPASGGSASYLRMPIR